MSINENPKIIAINREIEELEQKLKNVVGRKTEVYSRIVGYYRTVDNWNQGKRQEYRERKMMEVQGAAITPRKMDQEDRNNQRQPASA